MFKFWSTILIWKWFFSRGFRLRIFIWLRQWFSNFLARGTSKYVQKLEMDAKIFQTCTVRNYFRCGIGIFPLRAFSDTTSEIISNRVKLLRNLWKILAYFSYMNNRVFSILTKFKISKSLCQKLAIWFNSSSPPKFQPPIPSNMVPTFEFLFALQSHFPYKMKKLSSSSNFNIICKFLMQTSFNTNYPWHHVEFLLNLCVLWLNLANFRLLLSFEYFPKNRPRIPKKVTIPRHCEVWQFKSK